MYWCVLCAVYPVDGCVTGRSTSLGNVPGVSQAGEIRTWRIVRNVRFFPGLATQCSYLNSAVGKDLSDITLQAQQVVCCSACAAHVGVMLKQCTLYEGWYNQILQTVR
jgi:hypothetical protein